MYDSVDLMMRAKKILFFPMFTLLEPRGKDGHGYNNAINVAA